MTEAYAPRTKGQNFFIILLLGALSTVSPFSIDLYLAAFPQIAADLHTTVAQISLSLSSYFVGMAVGQVFYGPLLDRFGRKRPLYFGLTLFIIATLGCLTAHSVGGLVAFRFLQALGGCAAAVGATAMVRDFFHVNDSAKIFSLLMLILGVSPLLAPTVGSLIATAFGWQWVFILLAGIVTAILAVTAIYLPEGHQPDPGISLRPLPILKTFAMILRDAQFSTYALSGAFAFAGLLVYVAGSPLIFMGIYHVSAHFYGGIFATLAIGFIGSNQINIALCRKFSNRAIYQAAMVVDAIVVLLFLLCAVKGWLGLYSTIGFFFAYLSCLGITYPNAAALALAPFARHAGSASALLGFLQIGIAALASSGIGLLNAHDARPIVALIVGTMWAGLLILVIGRRLITQPIETDAAEAALVTH